MALTVARQLIVMAIIVAVSFFFSRKNNFGQKESQFLSRILLYVVNPCMILATFDMDFDFEKLKALGFSVAVSLAFHLMMMVLVTLFVKKRDDDFGKSDLGKIGIVFTNSGFIGIPLIKGVFGDEGVFYLMGYILVFNILIWTWGEYLMTKKTSPKKIFTNPNVLACFFGVAIFCLPFRIPYVLIEPVRMIGACNGAIAMMLLGLLFAIPQKGGVLKIYSKNLFAHSILRLVVCPLVVLVFVYFALMIFADVPQIKLILSVLFIATACPAGMSVSSYAVVFNKDAVYASYLVLLTSAACVATIPLLVLLMQIFC